MAAGTDRQGPDFTVDDFQEIFQEFLGGRVNINLVLDGITRLLDAEPGHAQDLQDSFDLALRNGHLPEQTWERLTAEVDHRVSEDEPTEWSEEIAPPQLSGQAEAAEPASDPAPVMTAAKAARPDAPEQQTPASPPPAPVAPRKESTAPLTPGTLLGDRFVLVSRVETGSMGDIYKALDRRLKESGAENPWVAIKVVGREFGTHPAAKASLLREAESISRLSHPNIVRVLDCVDQDEQSYFSMEWLDGESLAKMLNRHRGRPLPRRLADSIIKGLVEGLAHAHEQGIAHADIKPGNIFITRKGEVKLLDFGISRSLEPGNDVGPDAAAKRPIAHTRAYSSVDVLAGKPAGCSDDVFAAGLVIYRILSGKRAFGRKTAAEAVTEKLQPARIMGLNDPEWTALCGILALDAGQRCHSISDFYQAFTAPAAKAETAQPEPDWLMASAMEAGLDAEPVADDDQAGDPFGEPRPLWKKPSAWAAAIAALAVAGLLAWYASMPEEPGVAPIARSTATTPAPPEAVAATRMPATRDQSATPPADADLAAGDAGTRPSGPGTRDDGAAVSGIAAVPAADLQPVEVTVARRTMTPVRAVREPTAVTASAVAAARADTSNAANVANAAADPAPRTTAPEPAVRTPATADNPQAVAAAASATSVARPAPVTESAAAISPQASPAPVPESASSSAPAAEAAADTAVRQRPPPRPEPSDTLLASTLAAAMVTPESDPAGSPPAVEPFGPPAPARAARSRAPAEYGPEPPPAPTIVALSALEFERFVEPRFPRRLSAQGVTGWVEVEFGLAEDGRTRDVEVLASEPVGLFDEAAIDAVSSWRFKPYKSARGSEIRSAVRLRFEQE